MSFTPKFQTIWNSIIKNKILSIIFQKQGFYLMISKSRLVKYSLRYVALRQILNLQEFIKMLLPPNFMFFQSSLAIPWSTPWRKEKKQKFSIRHGVLHSIFWELISINFIYFELFLFRWETRFEWSIEWRTRFLIKILHDGFHH